MGGRTRHVHERAPSRALPAQSGVPCFPAALTRRSGVRNRLHLRGGDGKIVERDIAQSKFARRSVIRAVVRPAILVYYILLPRHPSVCPDQSGSV